MADLQAVAAAKNLVRELNGGAAPGRFQGGTRLHHRFPGFGNPCDPQQRHNHAVSNNAPAALVEAAVRVVVFASIPLVRPSPRSAIAGFSGFLSTR